MDTIIALSSGALPSGVAVLRLSGPRTADFIAQAAGSLPEPRRASLRRIRDIDGDIIDEALVLWFPSPNSFTGEDVAEVHLHGGKAVVSKVLELATRMEGTRIAEAGEFTRRAFANGRMDLAEAEGLADLIEAETEAQRKVARYLASGGLSALYVEWQDRLLNARAMIEADIDFADEDDVPGSVADNVWQDMAVLHEEIEKHLHSYGSAERIRDGFKISLIGRPNVGKSSLLNALSGSDRSIVSDEAGTTRDVVEVRLDLGGYLVLISDTAGLREDVGPVEAEGIRRAVQAAGASDLVLHLSDNGVWDELDAINDVDIVKVRTKTDLLGIDKVEKGTSIPTSVKNSGDIKRFLDYLTAHVANSFELSLASRSVKIRYLDHLSNCLQDLESAQSKDIPIELKAEGLRRAAHSLGRITGQYDTEDVLGRIFSSFCIGK